MMAQIAKSLFCLGIFVKDLEEYYFLRGSQVESLVKEPGCSL